jgi:transposase-like protein
MEKSDRATLRRRHTENEKRRIVEISLQTGASLQKTAQLHGICATTLSNWRKIYRMDDSAPIELLPVSILPQKAPQAHAMHIAIEFPSGTSLRIQSDACHFHDVATIIAAVR